MREPAFEREGKRVRKYKYVCAVFFVCLDVFVCSGGGVGKVLLKRQRLKRDYLGSNALTHTGCIAESCSTQLLALVRFFNQMEICYNCTHTHTHTHVITAKCARRITQTHTRARAQYLLLTYKYNRLFLGANRLARICCTRNSSQDDCRRQGFVPSPTNNDLFSPQLCRR